FKFRELSLGCLSYAYPRATARRTFKFDLLNSTIVLPQIGGFPNYSNAYEKGAHVKKTAIFLHEARWWPCLGILLPRFGWQNAASALANARCLC
ncbi:MAG: hypothetical protein Q4F38_10085, partial [Akkermansia sp.]|nr:hypothetical protein [Akkermansia sp.]